MRYFKMKTSDRQRKVFIRSRIYFVWNACADPRSKAKTVFFEENGFSFQMKLRADPGIGFWLPRFQPPAGY